MAEMYSIKWDKKSRKVGKVLEALADAMEKVIQEQVQVRLDAELDATFEAGYELALQEAREFGLTRLQERRTVDSTDKGSNEGNENV